MISLLQSPISPTADDAAAYARLLLRLHELSLAGKHEGDEADAIRDDMTYYWYRISASEQERLRWLAADLQTIEEGGAKSAVMSPDEKRQYQVAFRAAHESNDPDLQLRVLRQPFPADVPADSIPFLQARMWERLGNIEIALVFMKEAERLDPEHALLVMTLLQKLGRPEEAEQYAGRFLDDASADPRSVYLAASVYLERTLPIDSNNAESILIRIIPPLRRAFEKQQAYSQNGIVDDPVLESDIALELGLCLERTRQEGEAIKVYNQALAHVPTSHEAYASLLTARGLAHWPPDSAEALRDFDRAMRRGVKSVWPYLIVAAQKMRMTRYAEAVRICNFALENTSMSNRIRAELHFWVAVSYAKLGQPKDLVLTNFELAERLVPENETYRKHRQLYESEGDADQLPGYPEFDQGDGDRPTVFCHRENLELGFSEDREEALVELLTPA